MTRKAVYPTPENQAAAKAITEHFSTRFPIDAVLLVNSCARGKATRDSCLDIVVLAQPERVQTPLTTLKAEWERSVPLWQGSDYFARLQSQWLPYYSEELRQQRLSMVRHHCLNNLHHIPLYIERGLYFQSFDRLYNAYREFLQALFIARRTYPIAYNKWIREQIEDILDLPDLYRQLTHLFEIRQFESSEIAHKAREVEQWLDLYASEPIPTRSFPL